MRASRQEEDGGRAGGQADVRVEEMSERQGGVTGLIKELGKWGSHEDSGGLACGVAAAMACQGRLRHVVKVRVKPRRKQ